MPFAHEQQTSITFSDQIRIDHSRISNAFEK